MRGAQRIYAAGDEISPDERRKEFQAAYERISMMVGKLKVEREQ